tara:strand:- start:109 stop:411 length:303 start_codon:yes stop_codon:yes gene_type:complete
MLRSEIISELSKKIHKKLKKSEIEKVLKIILNTIVEEVQNNKSTEFRNFGTFSLKKIREKTNARNPRTNEKIYVPEKISIKFKMAKDLKNKINQYKDKLN